MPTKNLFQGIFSLAIFFDVHEMHAANLLVEAPKLGEGIST
jgi:hypothetical protein